MAVEYQWCTETRDDGETIETSVWPTRDDAIRFARATANTVVVLVRDTPTRRLWAYGAIECDPMPLVFEDAWGSLTGVRVPTRFRRGGLTR
jgi:hypothetical protein